MEARSRKRAEASTVSASSSTRAIKSPRTATTSTVAAAGTVSIPTRSQATDIYTPMDSTAESSTASASTARGRRGKAPGNSKTSDHNNSKKNHCNSKGNINLDKSKKEEPEIKQGYSGRSVEPKIEHRDVKDSVNHGGARQGAPPAADVLEGLLREITAELNEILPSSIIGSSSSSSEQSERFLRILADLSAEGEEGRQLEALTELTELLSMGTMASLRNFSYVSFVPVLVGLVNYESNPDIMLLASRALTHLVDVVPPSCNVVVSYGAVPCFVARLLTIEYIDLAEQSLLALKRISEEQPTACLRAGALMAVLSYLDFFSIGVQRVALSTAANICEHLPSDAADFVMEAVPLLTSLLQYHDAKVVEHASFCLTRIAEAFTWSPERLDDLCIHGVVTKAAVLISSSGFGGGQGSLETSTYMELIRLLSTFARGSALGAKSLHQLGISGILKDQLLGPGQLSSVSVSPAFGRSPEKVCEIVNLADELLPAEKACVGNSNFKEESNGDIPDVSAREKLLNEQPEFLQQFGIDLLPVLVQICSSSVDVLVRQKCLSVIRKIMRFSTSEMIQSLINATNISSFLAGVLALAWKDHKVSVLALEIAEILMEKHSGIFSSMFVREGVVHAVDAMILSGGDCGTSGQSSLPRTRQNTRQGVISSSSIDNTSVPTTNSSLQATFSSRASTFKAKYFPLDTAVSRSAVTDGILRLKNICMRLNMEINEQKSRCKGKSKSKAVGDRFGKESVKIEEQVVELIVQLLQEFSREESASTFEFMSSGVVSCLLNYFTCGYFSSKRISKVSLLRIRPLAIRRYKSFLSLAFPSNVEVNRAPMSILVQKLQNALSAMECFPLAQSQTTTSSSVKNAGSSRLIKLRLCRAPGEKTLGDYSSNVVIVDDPLTSVAALEDFLLPRVQQDEPDQEPSTSVGNLGTGTALAGVAIGQGLSKEKDSRPSKAKGKGVITQDQEDVKGPRTRSAALRSSLLDKYKLVMPVNKEEDELDNLSVATDEHVEDRDDDISDYDDHNDYDDVGDVLRVGTRPIYWSSIVHDIKLGGSLNGNIVPAPGDKQNEQTGTSIAAGISRRGVSGLIFIAEGRQLNNQSTIYQAVLGDRSKSSDLVPRNGHMVRNGIHTILYQRADTQTTSSSVGTVTLIPESKSSKANASGDCTELCSSNSVFGDSFIRGAFRCGLKREDPAYSILALLRVLDGLNRYASLLWVQVTTNDFAEGEISNLDNLDMSGANSAKLSHEDFVNSKLTLKLTQKIQGTLVINTESLPSWCYHLTKACPFLFPFETRCQYFYSTALGFSHALHRLQQQQAANVRGSLRLLRQKVRVNRNRILDSAKKAMEMYSSQKAALEVEYFDEVGTGLGPTLEFYTLLSHELQKPGLGMWRSSSYSHCTPLMLFPRPWPADADTSHGSQFSKVIENFRFLGQVMAKALQDGRLLDLPLSAAFYRLVLGQDLVLHDIISLDVELGTTLQELQALVCRKEHLESVRSYDPEELYFRGASVDDLCLGFSLPGYGDYILRPGDENVDISSLGDYVSLVVDATVGSGIMRQMEAFKSGFNQVFDISTLAIFYPNELDQLLCGRRELWKAESLVDHIKFDHGYTSNSPAIINFLEIVGEFTPERQRAFCRFVTGAPRPPLGGLAALNPKLTIVRKLSSSTSSLAQNGTRLSGCVDDDLPSVMTCANYLKLPPYSSKETMYKKLVYAISEGQGSFDLS